MLTHKIDNSYLEPNGERVIGTTTIWWNKWDSPNKTELYFSKFKHHDEDVKWRLLCNLCIFVLQSTSLD